MTIEVKVAIAVVLVLLLAYLVRRLVLTKQRMRRVQQVQEERIRRERGEP